MDGFAAREARRSALETISTDMGFLKRNVTLMMAQMGMDADEAAADVDVDRDDDEVVYEDTKMGKIETEEEAMA